MVTSAETRRGQLKMQAGVTIMAVLGDGYYSLVVLDGDARQPELTLLEQRVA